MSAFKLLVALVLVALVAVLSQSIDFGTPPPTFEAKAYTSWDIRRVGGSRRGKIYVPFSSKNDGNMDDFVSMYRLDLVGDAKTRGFAHGALMTKEIMEFAGPKLDKYFADEVLNLDISQFPDKLQKIMQALIVKGAIAAPKVFHEAMAWVWEQEMQYVPQNLLDEMDGIGQGMCSTLGSGCNATEWTQKIREVNMLPEVIRMACTSFGAWGKATGTANTLIHLRALDFGGGPFADYTVMSVSRKDPTNTNAFASVTFPGFVGVITGVSSSGVGVSEKVWMTYDKISLQPGKYNGEPDVFVLRDLLEKAKNTADAVEYVQNVRRTFAIWIGVGDYESKKFNLIGYKADSAIAYDDVTMPSMTGQPYIDSIAYVDKHPQPSGEGPTGTLPSALQSLYGNITCETTKSITKYHQTGDLHTATYDYGAKIMYVAIGRTNSDGQYYPEGSSDHNVWMAYNRPSLKFNLDDLWNGI